MGKGVFMKKYILGIALLMLASAGAHAQETTTTQTRFGALTVNDAGVLLFKGAPFQPTIEATHNGRAPLEANPH